MVGEATILLPFDIALVILSTMFTMNLIDINLWRFSHYFVLIWQIKLLEIILT